MKIILATHNENKCIEMKSLLNNGPFQILSLSTFPDIGEIIEDGNTLQENALIKARIVHQITSLPVISDDTGLEVDALNGQPGVYSARYAGKNCSYLDNINKLLENMKKIQNNRDANFRTVMVYKDNNRELIAEGSVKGYITNKVKGVEGFGYDPLFYVPEMNKTYAEMDLNEKNQISHRAKAMNNLHKLLKVNFPNIFQKMEDIA